MAVVVVFETEGEDGEFAHKIQTMMVNSGNATKIFGHHIKATKVITSIGVQICGITFHSAEGVDYRCLKSGFHRLHEWTPF